MGISSRVCSRVTFSGYTEGPTPANSVQVFNVAREHNTSGAQARIARAAYPTGHVYAGRLAVVTAFLGDRITDPEAITQTMAREVGR